MMQASPLGPRKRTYLALALLCLAAAGPAQWLVQDARRQALGPPRAKLLPQELLPIVLGGFRGPMIAGLAYYATEEEVAANIYSTETTIRTLLEIQPEFDHLWIYYAWVISYNLGAIINNPDEKYQIIRRGAGTLEKGLSEIAQRYQVEGACVNYRDPISGHAIDPSDLPDSRRRTFVAKGVYGGDLPAEIVGFADESTAFAWDGMTDDDRAIALEAARSGTLEYKRKRTTLLYMLGWTYYQKLAHGEEPRKHYRAWFIRDSNGQKDPFKVAYQFLRQASAVDVPPFQVSYEVIKTSPVHCLTDYGRALAVDPKIRTRFVAEVFERVNAEWQTVVKRIQNPNRVKATLEEVDLVTKALGWMATAEAKAASGNRREAEGALARAERALDTLYVLQPQGASQNIYRTRLDLAQERVRQYLAGEPVTD
jgi:hypothetical protein